MRHSHTSDYVTAIAVATFAFFIHWLILPYSAAQIIPIIYFSLFILMSWFCGFGAGALALLLGALALYIMPARQAMAVGSSSGLIIPIVFLGAGVSILLSWRISPTNNLVSRLTSTSFNPLFQAQTAKALRDSEERFRAAFNQSAVGMAQADPEGRHVLVNDRYCEITGYSRDELLACTFLDITHPDDIPRNRQQFEQLISRRTHSYELEKRYIKKNGDIVWVQVSVSFVLDEAGQPHYAIAGVQDISERKRKEETLRFLVNLNTASQQLVSPREIMLVTARMLGEHLNADRCAYAEVEADEDHFTIPGDYTRGVHSIVGRFSMASFGTEVLRLMRAGLPYVVHDVDTDPQVKPENIPAYRATSIQAVVCVPLQKAGRYAACMAVHQKVPRYWAPEEIELIQLVVARCWESIERARTISTLQESEQRLQFVLDSMPQKIFTAMPAGEVDYLNPQWRSFTGLGLGDLQGEGIVKLIHPQDVEKSVAGWQHSLETGTPFQFEHRFRRSDGVYRWHMTRVLPVRDARGSIVMWIGSSTDINDLKGAEEAAIERSKQVQLLAAMAARLNTAADVDSIKHIVTQEARRLLGAQDSIMVFSGDVSSETGAPIASAYNREKFNADLKMGDKLLLQQVCDYNRPLRLNVDAPDADPRWQSTSAETGTPSAHAWLAAPLVAKDGTNIGAIQVAGSVKGAFSADDEAVLVQLAQMASVALENARLMEGLRETSRHKDEFLATLAHELRNPLAPIRNILALMKQADISEEFLQQARFTMERQILHMVRLIDDLLDVSRLSQGKLELRVKEIDLADVIGQTLEAFQPSLKDSRHQLLVNLPPKAIYLRADPARLTQVLGNLIDNACKYSDPGGKISLSVQQEDEQVLIRVKDTGLGIPPDKLTEIFDMFSQVDQSLERPKAGLGIGLTLVKRLVEMHQGSITALSAGLGHGSEFVIRLPVLTEARLTPPDPAVLTPRSLNLQERILVVDDNQDAAFSLARLLEINGADTRIAHDGLEALAVAEDFRPHVLLLDIGMPKLNGYDVCERIRATTWGKEVLIIAVSGWGQEQDRSRSRHAGFDHHMVKPVNFEALTQVLLERSNPADLLTNV